MCVCVCVLTGVCVPGSYVGGLQGVIMASTQSDVCVYKVMHKLFALL